MFDCLEDDLGGGGLTNALMVSSFWGNLWLRRLKLIVRDDEFQSALGRGPILIQAPLRTHLFLSNLSVLFPWKERCQLRIQHVAELPLRPHITRTSL